MPHINETIIPEYLTPPQVARLTGFTTRALQAMRAKRRGPAFIKCGEAKCSPIRYRLEDIHSWMQAQEVAHA